MRYIGKSESGFRRPRSHLWPSSARKGARLPLYCWIRKLQQLGLECIIEVVREYPSDPQLLADAEVFWIAHHRFLGADLLNCTDGGEGGHGYSPSPETREKKRRALAGRPRPASVIAKISAAKNGRPVMDENGVVYTNPAAAARALGLGRSRVSACLNGHRRTAGGHTFKYAEVQ